MKARVREGSTWPIVTAFGGLRYDLHEWRDVPAGCEDEASRHPYLETLQEIDELPVVDDGPLEDLTLEELRMLGKAAKLPFAGTMKRETLLERLK